jgi:hypothetical protein
VPAVPRGLRLASTDSEGAPAPAERAPPDEPPEPAGPGTHRPSLKRIK